MIKDDLEGIVGALLDSGLFRGKMAVAGFIDENLSLSRQHTYDALRGKRKFGEEHLDSASKLRDRVLDGEADIGASYLALVPSQMAADKLKRLFRSVQWKDQRSMLCFASEHAPYSVETMQTMMRRSSAKTDPLKVMKIEELIRSVEEGRIEIPLRYLDVADTLPAEKFRSRVADAKKSNPDLFRNLKDVHRYIAAASRSSLSTVQNYHYGGSDVPLRIHKPLERIRQELILEKDWVRKERYISMIDSFVQTFHLDSPKSAFRVLSQMTGLSQSVIANSYYYKQGNSKHAVQKDKFDRIKEVIRTDELAGVVQRMAGAGEIRRSVPLEEFWSQADKVISHVGFNSRTSYVRYLHKMIFTNGSPPRGFNSETVDYRYLAKTEELSDKDQYFRPPASGSFLDKTRDLERYRSMESFVIRRYGVDKKSLGTIIYDITGHDIDYSSMSEIQRQEAHDILYEIARPGKQFRNHSLSLALMHHVFSYSSHNNMETFMSRGLSSESDPHFYEGRFMYLPGYGSFGVVKDIDAHVAPVTRHGEPGKMQVANVILLPSRRNVVVPLEAA